MGNIRVPQLTIQKPQQLPIMTKDQWEEIKLPKTVWILWENKTLDISDSEEYLIKVKIKYPSDIMLVEKDNIRIYHDVSYFLEY